MKITFKTSGGLVYLPAPGKPVILGAAQIDPQVADEPETCVREPCCFDLPAHHAARQVTCRSRNGRLHGLWTISARSPSRRRTANTSHPAIAQCQSYPNQPRRVTDVN